MSDPDRPEPPHPADHGGWGDGYGMDLVDYYNLWLLIAIIAAIAVLILGDWLITQWTTNILREYLKKRQARRRRSGRPN
jgi:hypothetical protein